MKFPAIPERRLQRVPHALGRRQLRRQCGDQAPQAGHRLPQFVREPGRGGALAGERAGADRAQSRLFEGLGPHAGYFKELGATSVGAKYYFGMPVQVMQGKPKEVFTQIYNNAFPAGTIGVEESAKQMNAAFGK